MGFIVHVAEQKVITIPETGPMVELFIVRRFESNFLHGFFETQIIVREGYRSNFNNCTGCFSAIPRMKFWANE